MPAICEEQPVQDFSAQRPTSRSQTALARGACGGLLRCVMPSARKTSSKDA